MWRDRLFRVFLSGVAMGLTPAPVSAFYLAWVALVPLWLEIRYRQHNLRQNALLAFVWGCGYHGLALFWITGVHPMTWMGVPWLASLAIALFCWLFITFWGAILVVSWAVLYSLLNRYLSSKITSILSAVALWCALEWLWSQGDLWWSSLAYTQSPHNLLILQFSQFSGPTTITALILVINGLIAESWVSPKRNVFLVLTIFGLLFLHWLGFIIYNTPVGTTGVVCCCRYNPLPKPHQSGNYSRKHPQYYKTIS